MTMTELAPLPTSSFSQSAAGMSVMLPSSHDPAFIGPLMLGTLLQFGIFSILATQGVVFFARQGHGLKDGRLFQLYAGAVLVFATLQVAMGIWRIYKTCVLLQPWALLPHAWFELALIGIVMAAVHGFFTYRCYKLSQSKLVLVLISVMLLAQGSAAIAAVVSSVEAVQLEEMRMTTIAVCSMNVVLDTVISVTLFCNLWRQRTGQGEVDAVILRIIRLTVECFVPCLICDIFILISIVNLGTVPLGSLFPFVLPLGSPLYANALFTTLNSRSKLRRQLNSDRENGQASIQPDISFHRSRRSDQGKRVSQLHIRRSTDPVQRGSMSYDIAFTNAVELSGFGGSESDQKVSNSCPLALDEDTVPDLSPEYPSTLSSRGAHDSSLPNV